MDLLEHIHYLNANLGGGLEGESAIHSLVDGSHGVAKFIHYKVILLLLGFLVDLVDYHFIMDHSARLEGL